MHIIQANAKYVKGNACIKKHFYYNKRVCLRLYNEMEEVLATATVNIPEVEVEEGHVLIKDYSENEGMLQMLIDNEIVEDTGVRVPTGFVTVAYCKLLI